MDLNFSDANGTDIGALTRYFLDLEESAKAGSNTFQVKTSLEENKLETGYFLYIEGTGYGGKIDSVKIDTKSKTCYHSGRTWRGMFETKVIEPDSGADYYTVSGEGNEVLGQIISKIGLSALFVASEEDSGIDIVDFQFPRYVDAYSGIIQMLSQYGAKLSLMWTAGRVVVAAVPIVDYSKETEISSDLFDFVIELNPTVVNHMIGLGQGELANRQVVHKYLDGAGNVVDVQWYSGTEEIVAVYDYPNCESLSELEEQTAQALLDKAINSKANITANDLNADIGDKFTATEINSGLSATQYVINKIVTIENDSIKTNYKVGDIL